MTMGTILVLHMLNIYDRKTAPFVTTIGSGGYQITVDVNLPNTASMLILLLSVQTGSLLVNTH